MQMAVMQLYADVSIEWCMGLQDCSLCIVHVGDALGMCSLPGIAHASFFGLLLQNKADQPRQQSCGNCCRRCSARWWGGTHLYLPWCRKLIAIGQSDAPAFLKNLQRLPVIERFAAELLQLFIGKTVSCGADGVDSSAPILSY